MANIQRVSDLELEQEIDFQQRVWRMQRVGWGVIALTVLAAMLGLFGDGS